MKNYLFIALTLGLSFMAFIAFQQAKPTAKEPIYKEIKNFSPYYIDKRFGGLQIMNKEDSEFKEKPTNMELFHRLESLEKTWAKTHLQIKNNELIINDNNGTEKGKILIKTDKEMLFVHTYYGI